MSLVVSWFWRDPISGEVEEYTDWSDGHHMAGAEATRRDLWVSVSVRRLGALLLPQLAESNLQVGPEDFDAFETEVRLLATDLNALRAGTGWRQDRLAHYSANFLRAIEYARSKAGDVMID
jgi:hypothetical protein